ncbi:MAG: TIGR03016 family PEP-CTERM system-associated outer membrane protein [Magnetospirillum sp.]|nr:TIGR03016 family PEP-CTERM system-associated outer membrane protein [Magnetospirillum sp.]
MTLAAPSAWAAEVDIVPSLAVAEKWTDNVLSTATDREADFITSVSPGLTVQAKGAGLELGLAYAAGYDHYAARDDLDGWRHEGLGIGTAEVIENWLFLDARASVSEQNGSAVNAAVAGDRTAARNRLRLFTTSIGPSLRHAFGSEALAELSYRHDQTSATTVGEVADTAEPADSVGDRGRFMVRTGEGYANTQASYAAEAGRVDRGSQVFTHVSHLVRVGQKVEADVAVLGHVGHDRVDDPGIDGGKVSGVFGGGGLHWAPSKVTDVMAEAGVRYGGLDVQVLGTHAIDGVLTVAVSHRSGLETEEEAFADALDRVQRDEEGRFVDPFSRLAAAPTASPFARSNSVFRYRRTDLAANLKGDRDTATLAATLTTRRDLGRTAVGGGETSAAGVTLRLVHELREDLAATAQLGIDDIFRAPTAAEKGFAYRAGLDLGYQINPTTTALAGYRYVDTRPDQGASVRENMLSLAGRKAF